MKAEICYFVDEFGATMGPITRKEASVLLRSERARGTNLYKIVKLKEKNAAN